MYSTGLHGYPSRRDDEGTYVASAWAVQRWHALSHYSYPYDHPPLGWILIALWTWSTHAWERVQFAVTAGREAMVAAHLTSCALMYVLARRLGVRRSLAAGAVVLFSFSPVALAYHRMVYLDNVATVFVLAAFVLALSPTRRLAAHAGSGVCFAAAVLTKETALLLLPALAYQLWQHSDRRSRDFSVALFVVLLAAGAAIYPLYAELKGELLPGPGHASLADGLRFQLFRPGSGEILDTTSVAHGRLLEWMHLDPWLLVGGAVATVAALTVRQLRPLALASLTLLVLLLRTGYLPIPYVIGLLTFAPLMIVGVSEQVWRWCAAPVGRHVRRPGGLSAGRAATALATCTLVVVALLVGPGWVRADARATEVNADSDLVAAERWVLSTMPHGNRVLVTDTLWIDMVRAGWSPGRVIWFYKIDSDPAVKRAYPHGWRDFDYVVSTAEVRASAPELPQVQAALSNSSVIASFGAGGAAVQIRRITLGAGRPS